MNYQAQSSEMLVAARISQVNVKNTPGNHPQQVYL